MGTLREWLVHIKNASQDLSHPIIIKLETKTKDQSGIFKGWDWAPVEDWGDWQDRLVAVVRNVFGDSLLITKGEFIESYHSSNFFLIETIEGLTSTLDYGKIIHSQKDYREALKKGVNRLVMNDAYRNDFE